MRIELQASTESNVIKVVRCHHISPVLRALGAIYPPSLLHNSSPDRGECIFAIEQYSSIYVRFSEQITSTHQRVLKWTLAWPLGVCMEACFTWNSVYLRSSVSTVICFRGFSADTTYLNAIFSVRSTLTASLTIGNHVFGFSLSPRANVMWNREKSRS